MLEFEVLQTNGLNLVKPPNCHELKIYFFREKSTDVIWIKCENTFKEMLNPATGLPLTYKEWREQYKRT